jgi:hypothetical protein
MGQNPKKDKMHPLDWLAAGILLMIAVFVAGAVILGVITHLK